MDYRARFYSSALGRFVQPDSIIPNPANPQAFNRYTYVLNDPIRFNDPSGHVCSDPDDLWSPSCDGGGGPPPNSPAPLPSAPVVINNPDPLDDGLVPDEPRRNRGGARGGGEEDEALLESLLGLWDDYNYYAGSSDIPLYQYYSWWFDLTVTGNVGFAYSNNSPWTISLFPPSLEHTFYQTHDGFSLNYDPINPYVGYGQSLPHSLISSVSGINVNPINGAVTSNLSLGSGRWSYSQSLTIKATVRPLEATVATVAGGIGLAYWAFGPTGIVAAGETVRRLAPVLQGLR
jgi:hypothetical protein